MRQTHKADVASELSRAAEAGARRDDKRRINALVAEIARLNAERDAFYAISSEPVTVKALRRPMQGGKRQTAAVAVASDWHVEERVDPRVVNGMNRYNPKIAEFRAGRFFECIRSLCNAYKRFEVRELILVLNGDLITGWIHEELQATNYMSPIEASAFVCDLVAAGISFLLKECPNIKLSVVCQTGNHGRTTLKRRAADPSATSYEWLVYHMLRRQFPYLDWNISQGLHTVFSVYDVRIHVTHGDTVKASGGVLGVLAPLNRAAMGWREKFHTDMSIVGHWHQYEPTRRIVMNGSLIGYSSFAHTLALAQAEVAQQAFFFVDAKRGVCLHSPLWVSDPSEEKKL